MILPRLDLKDESVAQPGTVISDPLSGHNKVQIPKSLIKLMLITISEVHKAMITSNKILVAAVNGPAPGWGTTSLALADLVYASPSAVFFTLFVKLRISTQACSSITLRKIMGRQTAASLLLAGDTMTAAGLETAGLITNVLPRHDFLQNVLEICCAGQQESFDADFHTRVARCE